MNAPFVIPTSNAVTRDRKSKVWARADREWYVEPERVSDQLLAVERFVGTVWDPCCGGGNVLRALTRAGVPCIGTDVVRRVPDEIAHLYAGDFDFLRQVGQPGWTPGAHNVMFNPPFYRAVGAEKAIRHALSLVPGKVCAYVEARFYFGADRAEGLYADHTPARVWAVTPRPSCPPGTYLADGNKAEGGTADYVWIVWDRASPSAETRSGHLHRGHFTSVREAAP